MDLFAVLKQTNVAAATGEILGTPQIIIEDLLAADGSVCKQGDCKPKEKIRVGRICTTPLPPPPPSR